MRVLVTGGAGYIGSHLVDRVLADGHDVVVIDDLSTGSRANLAHCLDRIRFVEGTILDGALVRELTEGCELVFHLAAAVGVGNIVADPIRSMAVNVDGTHRVLDACLATGAKMVLASTSEIYGKSPRIPMNEEDDRVLGSTTVARWSYSTAKALDEHLLIEHGRRGMPMAVVRYFNSYGPRLADNGYGSVVATFIKQALAGQPLTIHGTGRQTRSFTYVADTVEGTYRVGTDPRAHGQVFNIGNGAETSILELAEAIATACGVDVGTVSVDHEARYGAGFEDTNRRVPDMAKAARVLEWVPSVGLTEGLAATVAWWRDNDGGAR